jgi:hypothetical protein
MVGFNLPAGLFFCLGTFKNPQLFFRVNQVLLCHFDFQGL